MPTLNPFLYGKPVPPERFVGRQDAVRTVFSRLRNGESTAIVGEPHIGKSSLLFYVADEKKRSEWLGKDAARLFVTLMDCHMLSSDCTPADFWRQALADLPQAIPDDAVARHWGEVEASQFSPFKLKRLLDLLARGGQRIVLAIDEFDVLLNHPNFKANAMFFGSLRSMAIQTGSLAVITASRMPVSAMNRYSQELNPFGSPFFNIFLELRLLPLAYDEYRRLVEMTLADSGMAFSDSDYRFINDLTGRHPFLVQIAAACLFDATIEGKTGDLRYQAAGKYFHDRATAHFDDFWRHLSLTEQTVLVVLSLGELVGRVESREFDLGDLKRMAWFGPQLTILEDAGMVRLGRRPAARGVVWWVVDNILIGGRDVSFDEWLQDKEDQGLFTREESHNVRSLANSIPREIVCSPEEMIHLLLGEILKGRLEREDQKGDQAMGRDSIPPTMILKRKRDADEFDVFFCHNKADKPAVKEIGERLKDKGILPWLDEWELQPGLPWQKALEQQIKKIKCAAVFVGKKGVGPWQDMEQAAFLREFVKRGCPVIPVILSRSKEVPELPVFLAGMTWVDFRKADPDPLERLIWGITGERKSSP